MRQLYYPFRTWRSKIAKPVRPIFLTYSNDIYDLYQISFSEENDFSSSVIEGHKRYLVAEGHIVLQDLEELALRISRERKWNKAYSEGIPFPQADSLPRVIDLVSILLDKPMTAEDLALHYGFDPRQSDYYYNAARYLGLAESKKDPKLGTELRQSTEAAQRIFALPFREKFLSVAALVLAIEPINLSFQRNAEGSPNNDALAVRRVFAESAEAKWFRYSDTTVARRAKTIQAWTSWLNALAGG
jgi:hypothetical protein